MPDSEVTLFIGEIQKQEIPKGPFVVKTRNSAYQFGRANKKGERLIKRLSTNEENVQPLEFTRCKILNLAIGDQMQVKCLNGPENLRRWGWHTSVVKSVEMVK